MLALEHALLADALLPAVFAAGSIEMRHYRAGVMAAAKTDQSPVTIADQEAEAVLLAQLAEAAPGVPVIAEEAVSAGRLPPPADVHFLVDPLDGTREFIEQRGEFTINIALVRWGAPVFGMVYAPALGELYMTLAADQAVLVKLDPEQAMDDRTSLRLADLSTRTIRTRVPRIDALTALASRSHSNAETEAFLARFNIAERTNAGSSLKFCVIARGDADLYPRLGPTMEWDTAAAHAVLLAAGGSVTCMDGAPLTYGKRDSGLKNPHFVAWATPTALTPQGGGEYASAG